MLYEFQTVEATQSLCCTKGEGKVDHSAVTRWFKKFCLIYKNLDDQVLSCKPKIRDSKNMLQAIEANLASSTESIR